MDCVTRISFPKELVLRVLQGDREAQFEFYASVRLYIMRICSTHYRLAMEDIEDICQNISLSLYRNLEGIEGDVGAWVNGAINGQMMKRKRHPVNSAQDASRTSEASIPIEAAVGIWEAMERLNAFCKRLIVAHIIQGYTRAEAAKTTGIPYGSLPYRRKQSLTELFQHYSGGAIER